MAPVIRKRPAWLGDKGAAPTPLITPSTQTPASDDNGLGLFSRGKHTRTWAEEEQARKLQRAARGSASPEAVAERSSPPVKKRRLSDDKESRTEQWVKNVQLKREAGIMEEQDEGGRAGLNNGMDHVRQTIERDGSPLARPGPERGYDTSPVKRTTREKNKAIKVSPVKPTVNTVAIEIEDDHSDVASESGSDDDFDTILRRAERRRRQQDQHTQRPIRNAAETPTPLGIPISPKQLVSPISQPKRKGAKLKLFIHSSIPDTKPLFVDILSTQALGIVTKAWCSRQDFDEEFAKDVFLTWRGLKIYTFTTCESLGVEVDADGEVYWKVGGRHETNGVTQLEMEAVTDEILRVRKEKEEQEAQRQQRQSPSPAPSPRKANDPNKRCLVIKSQGRDEVKLRVPLDTKMARLVDFTLKKFSLDSSTRAFLRFDGERLDANTSVQDLDIEDFDQIEFHFE